MIYSEVIIVGGGPAGSTCAWQLKKNKIDCIILDYAKFPRTKLCAGWITPKVIKRLQLKDYPHKIISLKTIHVSFFGIKIKRRTSEYSIRRYELDDWLLKRSNAKVYKHKVINIKKEESKESKEGSHYIIDNKYKCKYLIGAGGTICPVYTTFFRKINPRSKKHLAVCMEQEFKYEYKKKDCRLWFFDNGLNGYSWYVPKGNGYINVGIGGLPGDKKSDIQEQWNYFIKKLKKLSLIHDFNFNPKGYIYYTKNNANVKRYRLGNAFIVGDSAGLATNDLAEGIGPAVESGILAANSIINGTKYSLKSVKNNSCPILLSYLIRLGGKINQAISFFKR